MRHLSLIITTSLVLVATSMAAATFDESYKAGVAAYQARQFAQAAAAMQDAVASNPSSWQAWQVLCLSRYQAGDKAGALQAGEKCLELNPNNPSVRQFVDSLKAQGITAPATAPESSSGASAPAKAKRISFGPKIGLLMTRLSIPSTDEDYDFTEYSQSVKGGLNLAIGGMMEYELSPRVSLQGEVAYMKKSSKYEEYALDDLVWIGTTNEWWTEATTSLDFVALAPLVKLYLDPKKKFFALAGPSLNLCLGGTYEGSMRTRNADSIYVRDVTEEFSMDIKSATSLELAFVVGAGVKVQRLTVDVRAELGLTDLYDAPWEDEDEDDPISYDVKSTCFGLSVGYLF